MKKLDVEINHFYKLFRRSIAMAIILKTFYSRRIVFGVDSLTLDFTIERMVVDGIWLEYTFLNKKILKISQNLKKFDFANKIQLKAI